MVGARAGKPELRGGAAGAGCGKSVRWERCRKCVLLRNTRAGRLRSVRPAGEYGSGSAEAAGKYSVAG